MAEVTVSINERSYILGCDDGEEKRLQDLARHVDRHVREISESMPDVSDVRLMLLASLTVADELTETLSVLREIEGAYKTLKEQHETEVSKAEQVREKARKSVEAATQRIETIAGRLASA
ncbi:MAG: cell division protein ZapA [Alphaproteobacteria bacterium]